ncbi:MAG: hypothetical protein MZV64_50580 [Ignavibacteriales bacterium]|nr:hypothetical protein [Ignavibacteriales bacterium]
MDFHIISISLTGLSKNDFGHFGFPYHLYFFNRRSLAKLVDAAEFHAIHFESWSHLLKDGKRGILTDIIIAATKKYCLSDYIIVVAQKKSYEGHLVVQLRLTSLFTMLTFVEKEIIEFGMPYAAKKIVF